MVIGIDVDDTLVNTSQSFDNIIKKYNINFNKRFKDDWTTEEFDFICNNYNSVIIEGTIEQLKNENINITEFYFNEEEKAALAKKLKLDLMIDDSYRVYENMKKENIDCILFGEKIKTWKEVLEYIKKKEG